MFGLIFYCLAKTLSQGTRLWQFRFRPTPANNAKVDSAFSTQVSSGGGERYECKFWEVTIDLAGFLLDSAAVQKSFRNNNCQYFFGSDVEECRFCYRGQLGVFTVVPLNFGLFRKSVCILYVQTIGLF